MKSPATSPQDILSIDRLGTPVPFSFSENARIKDIREISRRKKIKVYLVGGCWRDYFLGKDVTDFDFAVSRDAIGMARAFAKAIKGAFVLLDEEHGCARVVRKERQGIVTPLEKNLLSESAPTAGEQSSLTGFTFDFADFRAATLQKDLLHRDFTVNTLCVDINTIGAETKLSDILIDSKAGLRDLKAKKIKMTVEGVFKEDPLRLVRAFSLQAELGFAIEKKTLERIKKDRDSLKGIAYERIRDELFKICASKNAAVNFKNMAKVGLLERIMPQVTVMYNVAQGGYHHLDVWAHSLMTVAELEGVLQEFSNHEDIGAYLKEPLGADRSRLALMKLAALLHDIGKPQTRKKEKGKISFHGHERVGAEIIKNISDLLKLSTREKHALEDMVLWHLRPGYLSNFENPTPRAVFRYFRDTKEEGISILLLSLADQRATRGPMTTKKDQAHHERIIRNLLRHCLEKKKEKPLVRLINGNDLIRKLKLTPSPIFAKILNEVEEKQAMGKVTTKDEALKLARSIANKK
ncbi:MAG TPA: HD domain-containing protein [Candidatus Omnitrophota bacterium]|nr:HD domain-containing protein [Candidatus Omnitrophota bacterium]HPD84345.1 HD domain-containing protein [Candidatus Omnitrophota bacterium]HRZ03203.1 HD domain-containing protein [Candidatus Omnitrophota bacterium]